MAGTRFPFLILVLPFGKFLTEPGQRNLFGIRGAGRHAWPQFSCAWGRLHLQIVGLGYALQLQPGTLGACLAGASRLHSPLKRCAAGRVPSLGQHPAEIRGLEKPPSRPSDRRPTPPPPRGFQNCPPARCGTRLRYLEEE